MGTIARAAYEDRRRAEARRAAYDLKHTPRDPNAYKRELFADLKKQGINFKQQTKCKQYEMARKQYRKRRRQRRRQRGAGVGSLLARGAKMLGKNAVKYAPKLTKMAGKYGTKSAKKGLEVWF